jgi:peptidoglycan/xylan/chitin deacetylase (PgdA/CDA1 family)
VETIQKITGQKPIGWNAYWMRNSVHILETLQDLGFVYHIDEPSHDEPFIVPVRGKDFVTVPYTFHMNDIVSFPFEGWNPAGYDQALKDEFDQLYEEGTRRRRMMVISLHDRISGHAGRVRELAKPTCGSPARTRSLATRSPTVAPSRSWIAARPISPAYRGRCWDNRLRTSMHHVS